MEEQFTELQRTLDKLTAAEDHRASLIEYRDRQLTELRASGATWQQLQDFTGLSPRGLKLALDRARATEAE